MKKETRRIVLVLLTTLMAALSSGAAPFAPTVFHAENPDHSPVVVEQAAAVEIPGDKMRFTLQMLLHSRALESITGFRFRGLALDERGDVIRKFMVTFENGLMPNETRAFETPLPALAINGAATVVITPLYVEGAAFYWKLLPGADVVRESPRRERFKSAPTAISERKQETNPQGGCSLQTCRDNQLACWEWCSPSWGCAYCERRAGYSCEGSCVCVAYNQDCPPSPYQ